MDESRPDVYQGKIIVKLVEKIKIIHENGEINVDAKVDTGATTSSIDVNLAKELNLGPVVESTLVKSAHGSRMRDVVEADIELHGKPLRVKFTLAERKHMRFRALIGVNILQEGFLVDPIMPKDFVDEKPE
ncbi:MAG: RimK/LysX family protein [Nanoarchaeota archaeon]